MNTLKQQLTNMRDKYQKELRTAYGTRVMQAVNKGSKRTEYETRKVADSLGLKEDDPKRKAVKRIVSNNPQARINQALKSVDNRKAPTYRFKAFAHKARNLRRTP
jgi:hypothetical protein